MRGDNPLGEFLQARRGLVQPGDHGLPAGGQRRVPGLRRAEIATLAGLSVDYYMRLEQGRDRNPSLQVIDALAPVLQLDADARAHLRELAGHHHAGPPSVRDEQVGPELQRLLEAWERHPALVLGRRYDVLAANPLGAALFPTSNLVRFVFEPGAGAYYPDWDRVARNTVAGLRAVADRADPELQRLVTELGTAHPEFARLWKRHDVAAKTHEAKRIDHPEVGALTLTYDTFTVNSAPGQQLVVYQAEPGSPSDHALTLLGIVTAGHHRSPHPPRPSPP
jgi:transcriptional regulator with XRE-family HTH domain